MVKKPVIRGGGMAPASRRPEDGNQRSCVEKIAVAIRANQKIGTETPVRLTARRMLSRWPLARSAATIPRPPPTMTAMRVAVRASSADAGPNSCRSDSTGREVWVDSPRSPRNSPPR